MADSRQWRLLVSNDDGIDAPGIIALVTQLNSQTNFDVRVSSPAVEQSAKSFSVTMFEPLAAEPYRMATPNESVVAWRVHGTPVDSVKLALTYDLFGDHWRPDLVLSGINKGSNSGLNIHYSGTVAAAREANFQEMPSMALSLAYPLKPGGGWHFKEVAERCVAFVNFYFTLPEKERSVFKATCLNINFPNEPVPKGWRITHHGNSRFDAHYVERKNVVRSNPELKEFDLRGRVEVRDPDCSYDTRAIREGWVSVTPLGLTYPKLSECIDAMRSCSLFAPQE